MRKKTFPKQMHSFRTEVPRSDGVQQSFSTARLIKRSRVKALFTAEFAPQKKESSNFDISPKHSQSMNTLPLLSAFQHVAGLQFSAPARRRDGLQEV